MKNPSIDKIRCIVLDHLDDGKLGVSELASIIGWSRSQLYRKVMFLSGKSVNQFINETRLQEAAKFILNSNLSAAEISYKVGFNSPSYFNKCFSKYYGVTPGEYKEQNKEISIMNGSNQYFPRFGIKKGQTLFYIIGIALLTFVSISIAKNIIYPPTISIAVLYFDDHSQESDLEWFCSGITEEIIANLSDLNRLNVSSRTSVKQFINDSEVSIPEIAKKLGVDYVLEGSVLKYKDSVRITAQLINTKDKNEWSIVFYENLDNSLKIQSEFSKLIVQQLKIDLSPEELKIIDNYPTDNMEAYNLFLKAEYQKNLFNKNASNIALPLYQQAIALDSTFVEAYIGLSETWQVGGIVWGLYEEQTAWENSKKLLLKARSIDSTNNRRIDYDLHFGYFYYEWDFEKMEKYYQRRLLKSNYKILTGVIQDYALKTGRYNEALLINERYIENSPTIKYIYAYKAEILMFLGKKKEALEILERYNSLFSDDMFYLRESTKLYFYLEEYDLSKNQLKKIRNQFPGDDPCIFIWLDAVFAQMNGKKEDAALYLDQLINRYNTINAGSPAWFIALYYCYFQDYENTFIWLQKSYERHEVELSWLREEPILIPLRDDPRYKVLYQKIGFIKIE